MLGAVRGGEVAPSSRVWRILPRGRELECLLLGGLGERGAPSAAALLSLDALPEAARGGHRRARAEVVSWERHYLCPFQHVRFVNSPESPLPCFVSVRCRQGLEPLGLSVKDTCLCVV